MGMIELDYIHISQTVIPSSGHSTHWIDYNINIKKTNKMPVIYITANTFIQKVKKYKTVVYNKFELQ